MTKKDLSCNALCACICVLCVYEISVFRENFLKCFVIHEHFKMMDLYLWIWFIEFQVMIECKNCVMYDWSNSIEFFLKKCKKKLSGIKLAINSKSLIFTPS